MPRLPMPLLKKRLLREEQELKENGYSFNVVDLSTGERGRLIKVPTTEGEEFVEVVKRYRFIIKARGYEKTPEGEIRPRDTHEFYLYVLRHYPFSDPSSRFGAPIRFKWLTPIFHPNISNGVLAGGKGIVCWHILENWMTSMSLLSVLKGIKFLVEKPNLSDYLIFPETREAAMWYEKMIG